MAIQVTYGPKAEQPLFEDVRPEDYFYDAVKWAAERGITDGVGGGLFGSGDPCTREQIVTFLFRAMGSHTKPGGSFSDVSADAWYAAAVEWAAAKGVTSGIGGGLFAPDNSCTRAQIATFLYRCAK